MRKIVAYIVYSLIGMMIAAAVFYPVNKLLSNCEKIPACKISRDYMEDDSDKVKEDTSNFYDKVNSAINSFIK